MVVQELSGTVKVETWVLCLVDFISDEPSFYYNPVDDIFERKFNNKCAYWSEKQCAAKDKELNIDGLQIVKGTMDVPKQFLVDSIMEFAIEQGLVKREV